MLWLPMLLAPMLLPLAFAPPEGIEAAQAIFDESCTLCHDASDDTLNLEDARALIGKPSSTGKPLIDPGNPNNSYLYLKLVGAEGIEGDPMPLGGDPLPVEQQAAVRDWIASLPAAGGGEGPPPDDGGGGETSGGGGEVTDGGGGEVEPPGDDGTVPKQKPKPRQPFFGTHNINFQTTTTLGKKTISFRIHHRLGLVGGPGDRTYLGLAGGAIMSMGMEYGIIDGLDVMARWTNSRLDWELGLKYVPVRQEEGMPLSFGMYASFEALTDFPTNSVNRLTGNFQILMSRLWFDRWATQLVVNYSLLTNHAPTVLYDFGEGNGPEPVTDNRGTLGVGIASTVMLGKKRKHGIDIEYYLPIPTDAFYYRGGNVDPNGSSIGSWGLGWSARTGLHVFQVIVTNTRNIHTNLIAPGGDTFNPFKPFGDFFFGFNITRKWKL
jgi:mono/diheme cytochrome c family protein